MNPKAGRGVPGPTQSAEASFLGSLYTRYGSAGATKRSRCPAGTQAREVSDDWVAIAVGCVQGEARGREGLRTFYWSLGRQSPAYPTGLCTGTGSHCAQPLWNRPPRAHGRTAYTAGIVPEGLCTARLADNIGRALCEPAHYGEEPSCIEESLLASAFVPRIHDIRRYDFTLSAHTSIV